MFTFDVMVLVLSEVDFGDQAESSVPEAFAGEAPDGTEVTLVLLARVVFTAGAAYDVKEEAPCRGGCAWF